MQYFRFPASPVAGGSATVITGPLGSRPAAQSVSVALPTDQTVPVMVTNFPATQPVSGTVAVSNFPANQTVTVSNFPSTQTVTGTVVANQGTAGASAWKVDGSSVTQPISAAALPLAAGASTSALQTTGNTSLASIDTKTPAQGQAASAASSPVVIASDQSKLPVAVPDSNASGTLTAAGQTVTVGPFNGLSSWSVFASGTFSAGSTITWEISDDNVNWTAVNGRQTGTGTGTAILGSTASGPGPLTYRGNCGGTAYFRVRCTVFQAGDSIAVVAKCGGGVGAVFLNSAIPGGVNNIGFVSSAGKAKSAAVALDYSSTTLTNAAYVQLIASTAAAITKVYPFDSSGAAVLIAVGGAGSEVDQIMIPPGGSGAGYELAIPSGSRVSLKLATFATNPTSVNSGVHIFTGLN